MQKEAILNKTNVQKQVSEENLKIKMLQASTKMFQSKLDSLMHSNTYYYNDFTQSGNYMLTCVEDAKLKYAENINAGDAIIHYDKDADIRIADLYASRSIVEVI